jgi:hypothetical protein
MSATIVHAALGNATQALMVITPSGHRQVVKDGDFELVPTSTFTLALLTAGVGGRPPQVLKVAQVTGGHVMPLLGLPVQVAFRPKALTRNLSVLTVSTAGSGGGSPCHLLSCPPTHYGEPPRPAQPGPPYADGQPGHHCVCGGKVVDPLGWGALYGAPSPIIGPGGGPGPFPRPDVPSAPEIANTDRVQPCAIVQTAEALNGPVQSLTTCLAQNRGPGALIPEPTPSPYAATYSSEPVVNPFVLDGLY